MHHSFLDTFFGSWIYQVIYLAIALIVTGLWMIDYTQEENKEAPHTEKVKVTTTEKIKPSEKITTTITETIYEYEEDTKSKSCFVKAMWHFSDFFVSFVGWICLYVLLYDIKEGKFDSFNIFLATVAIISISGYGYKLFEKLRAS